MKVKVLLVDDSPLITTMMKSILESKGLEVRVASTGMEALLSLYQEIPDVLFLDIMLPDMTGYMISRIIKEDPRLKEIPVILLTGQEERTTKFWSMEAGADYYMSKGNCKPDYLLETLTHILQKFPPTRRVDYQSSQTEMMAHILNLLLPKLEELTIYQKFSKLYQLQDPQLFFTSVFDLYSYFIDYSVGAFFFPKSKKIYQYSPTAMEASFVDAMKRYLARDLGEEEKKSIGCITLDSFFHLKQCSALVPEGEAQKQEAKFESNKYKQQALKQDLRSFFYYPIYEKESKVVVMMLGSVQDNLVDDRIISLLHTSIPLLKSLILESWKNISQ